MNDQTSQKPAESKAKSTPDAVFVAHSGCFVGLVTHSGIRGQEWLSRFMHALRGEIKNKYRQPTTTYTSRASGQTEQLNHDFPLNTQSAIVAFLRTSPHFSSVFKVSFLNYRPL